MMFNKLYKILLGFLYISILYYSYNILNLHYDFLINGNVDIDSLINGHNDIDYTNMDLIYTSLFILFGYGLYKVKIINQFIQENLIYLLIGLGGINLFGLYLNNFSLIVLLIEIRIFIFIVFIETLFWFFNEVKVLRNNKNLIRFYLFFILVFVQFLSFKLGFFLEYPELFKGSILNFIFEYNILYIFYNPVLPLLNISLLQLILCISFGSFIYFSRGYLEKYLNKKELYYLVLLIGIGLLFNIFLGQHNILETDYHQIDYSYRAGELNFLGVLDKLSDGYYGIGFHDFLNLFTRFAVNNHWNIFYTFGINSILNTFNIFVIFILSLALWRNKIIAYFNSIFYFTSFPILIYFTGENTYTLANTFLMFLLFFLFEFYYSNYNKFYYFYLSILSVIFLFYTHHNFILLPLIFIVYFILFFRKNILTLFLDIKKIIFYILTILLTLPVVILKFQETYLSGNEGAYSFDQVFSQLFNYNYLLIGLFTKINPFLNFDKNILLIVYIFIFSIIGALFYKKNTIKIIVFSIILYYLIFFPFYYTFNYALNGYNGALGGFNASLNYFNSWLTDYNLKYTNLIFLFILFLGFTPYVILKYIKNYYINKIVTITMIILILAIPILNFKKLQLNFNQQNNFNFFTKVQEYLKDQKSIILYGEHTSFGYAYLGEIYGNQLEQQIQITKIDWEKDNFYYLGSYCYEHSTDETPNKCIYFENHNSIRFQPIFEKEFDCIPYDIEEVCDQDIMKLGLYKIEKINN